MRSIDITGENLARQDYRRIGILALAAIIRLWGLDRNGFGTEYYSASVRSMLDGPHNFLFASFDPAGFVSVDKPPVALWVQVASAKLFGFSGLSVLLPQVVEGVFAVLLLDHLVRRRFGAGAGLLAGLFLALMPVSIAVDRSSNTDSCLVLVLLLATWALIVAMERASWRLLVLSMLLIGIGFATKMLAAFGVVPVFMLVYLRGAGRGWRRSLGAVAASGMVALVVGLGWFVAYDLTPPEDRPFAGSTQGNSMIEMAFVQYGLDRFIPHAGRRREAAGQDTLGEPGSIGFQENHVPAGPLRLADPRLAGQVGWFWPLALLGGLAASLSARGAARSDLLLWAGWALTYGAVFSYADGTFHSYYLVAMAPPVAALTAIGLVSLVERWRDFRVKGWLLAAALPATALWQAALTGADWAGTVGWAVLGLVALACIGLVVRRAVSGRRDWAGSVAAFSLAALLVLPAIWDASLVFGRVSVDFPAADVALLAPPNPESGRHGRQRHAEPPPGLITFLTQNRQAEPYLLATMTATEAAPIIIQTGQAVMALGGYSGADPILSEQGLAQLVASGALRYALLPPPPDPGQTECSEGERQPALLAWIRSHGIVVDPALWRESAADTPIPGNRHCRRRGAGGWNSAELYDLRPPPS